MEIKHLFCYDPLSYLMKDKPSKLRDLLEKKGHLVSANVCYNCSTCVNLCPAAIMTEGAYNPRTIIQLANSEQEYRLYEDLNPNVWLCTACETCHDECPQGVHLHEILLYTKNVASMNNNCPENFIEQANSLCKHGKSIPSSNAIERRRKTLGLPEVLETDVKEMRHLIRLSEIIKLNVSCPKVKESAKNE